VYLVLQDALPLIPNHLALSISGPEKAGVGGSIPSLATTFSITYTTDTPRVCSILFQNQFRLAGICLPVHLHSLPEVPSRTATVAAQIY
jgi:hypothetical protein